MIWRQAAKTLFHNIRLCGFPLELLRCGIAICNPHIPAGNTLSLRNAEVDQYKAVIVSYHNIRRLQIAVYDRCFQMMEIMQYLRKLYAPIANLPFFDFLPQCQNFVHGTALHIPFHEENPLPAFKDVDNLR